MHQVYKITGFVFKKENRLEADRVFSVFAKDMGRVEIFAKSIRAIASKLKAGIDIFGISEIEFVQGKNRKTLTDAVLEKKFSGITQVPEKSEVAHRVSLLVDTFIKGQESDEKIWNVVVGFFEKLNACQLTPLNLQITYHYFFWNFVSALGYKPELAKCVHCGNTLNPENLYFSNKEGGILCASCFGRHNSSTKIHPDTVKLLRLFLAEDWQMMLKVKMNNPLLKLLEDVSNNYYNYLISVLN